MKTIQPIPLRSSVALVLVFVLVTAGIIGLMAWFTGI